MSSVYRGQWCRHHQVRSQLLGKLHDETAAACKPGPFVALQDVPPEDAAFCLLKAPRLQNNPYGPDLNTSRYRLSSCFPLDASRAGDQQHGEYAGVLPCFGGRDGCQKSSQRTKLFLEAADKWAQVRKRPSTRCQLRKLAGGKLGVPSKPGHCRLHSCRAEAPSVTSLAPA